MTHAPSLKYPSVHCKDVIGFDVNVNGIHPYSRTTYANDVKKSKLGAGTTAILNISYASYSRGNYTLEKYERKRRKKKRRAVVPF